MTRTVEETRKIAKTLNYSRIGIPFDEVGDKLKALDKSLRENGMVLKADTGVHINCSRDKIALGFVLEVVVFEKEKEEEKENG